MLRRRDFLAAAPAPFLTGLPVLQKSLQAERSLTTKGKSCILILLVGGPSQIDTWDPKANLPADLRSPWRTIKTNVPGIEITELFPRMARQADKYCLVRSVFHDGAAIHEVGHQLVQTGSSSLGEQDGLHVGCTTGSHAVLPCPLGNTGCGNVPNGQSKLGPLAPTDLDFRGEPEKIREKYGRSRFGQSCLMARRLVERGTRFTTINMFESVFDETTWDAHGSKPFSTLASYRDYAAPVFDRAYSALLEDLSARGLLESTLVVATGEFGRTPKINPAGDAITGPNAGRQFSQAAASLAARSMEARTLRGQSRKITPYMLRGLQQPWRTGWALRCRVWSRCSRNFTSSGQTAGKRASQVAPGYQCR